jgi:superfamily II DNA or RNA helicase
VSNCHGLKGKVLTQIITEQASSIMYRFGVTGTLPKDPADAMAVVAAVGPVRVEIPAHELIADGTLADLHISIMQLDEDLTHQYEEYLEMERQTLAGIMSKPPSYKQFKDGYFGDFASEKAYLQRKEDRLQWIADMIMVKRETSKGNVMCLVDSIPFGRKLRDMIPNAIFVNGKDVKTTNDKQRIYDMFNDFDDLVVIATVHIAGVGVSIDRIFHLFLIDIGKSFVRVIQAIGRGLRKSHDKDFVGVVDVCSDLKYSKKHLAARINFYKEARYPHKKHLIKYMEMC